MKKLLFIFTYALLLSSCVNTSEPFDGGLIDGPAERVASVRASAFNQKLLSQTDIVFTLIRTQVAEANSVRAFAAFDLDGFVAHPKVLTINEVPMSYHPRVPESFDGGYYVSDDPLLWGSDDTTHIAYQDLAGEDFAFTAPLAKPFKISASGVDTLETDDDLVIQYAASNPADSLQWRIFFFPNTGRSITYRRARALDNGTITIPADIIRQCKDSSDIRIELSRFVLYFTKSSAGRTIGVESEYSELRSFYLRRKK